MINDIMTMLHKNEGLEPSDAGLQWLKDHPERYRTWLKGVATIDGKPAVPAFESTL
jgi:glycine betaine/proline transport system substrate-binding protein